MALNDNTSANKTIVFNTIVLYVKLIISIIVGLYTSRLVLQVLGADDYGLYSVVGGIVTMLNIMGASMVSTSYRYISVELGKGAAGNPNKVYNTVLVIHIALAVLLIVVGESLGIWYVNEYLNVAAEKIPDARFVLHMSLLATAFTVLSVPANGLIIAREKFMYTSIVEIAALVFKLVLVILLASFAGNKLRAFAVIMAVYSMLMPLCYQIYCRIKDKEIIKWNFNRNKKDYKDVFSFAVWMMVGALAVTGRSQGSAMIINFFFGTALNAAFGLAQQVSRYTGMFSKNLSQAAVPQIMKSYGAGDSQRSMNLTYAISRLSFLIKTFLVVPLVLCMNEILTFWLKEPPEYTNIFATFLLINGLVSVLGAGFDACIQSTGKIVKNQIGYSIINLALLPIIFVLYKMGLPPYINVFVLIACTVATLIFQIYIMSRITDFKLKDYMRMTFVPCMKVLLVTWLPLWGIRMLFGSSLAAVLAFVIIAVIWIAVAVYLVGMTNHEREIAKEIVVKRIKKKQ